MVLQEGMHAYTCAVAEQTPCLLLIACSRLRPGPCQAFRDIPGDIPPLFLDLTGKIIGEVNGNLPRASLSIALP
jgi:hypothetical protein